MPTAAMTIPGTDSPVPVPRAIPARADGRVDLLGLTKDFNPRFVRHYADLGTTVTESVGRYVADVRARAFPGEEESAQTAARSISGTT